MGQSKVGVVFAAGLQDFLSSSHSDEVHTAFHPTGDRGTFPGRYSNLGMKLNKIVFEKLVIVFQYVFWPYREQKNHYYVQLQA
jgi:hypothetical protein